LLERLVVKKSGTRHRRHKHRHEEDVTRLLGRRRRVRRSSAYRSPFSYTAELLNGKLCDRVGGTKTANVKVYVDRDHFYDVRRQLGSLQAAKVALQSQMKALFGRANNLYKARRTGLDYDIRLSLKAVKPTRIFPQPSSRFKPQRRVDARDYMEYFCSTYRHHLYRPHTDHLVLVTGKEPLDDSFEGLAMDFGVMCSRRESCSLVFARAEEPSVTVAHEIGHSIGLYHDGPMADYGNGCPVTRDRHYIMSPWTTNYIQWSRCSSKEMHQNLGCFACMVK
jgi:hypothetical protein